MPQPLSILRAFILLIALVLLPMAVWGLCCTMTLEGRMLSVAGGMLGLGPLLWCIEYARVGKGLLSAGVAGFMVVGLRAPDGHTEESARIHARYADHSSRYATWSIGGLLPAVARGCVWRSRSQGRSFDRDLPLGGDA